MTKILLREITKCTDEQKKSVRKVRNQESVRKSMYTEHEIPLNEHLAWVERLQSDNRQIVFVVLVDEVVSGVVSVNAIDRLHLKSDWAFYLDANVRGGLGAALEFGLINFVFQRVGLEKLNCEVIETNEAVVKLHKKFGFVEEGFRRENIIKNENRMGVFFLGLTRSDWEREKETVKNRYEKVINKFDLEIEYEPA
jgi:UDP-4-amino-4,6-dideoxy-N-acetyl-beta-L-altrosamine N-acetyltransferase